MRVSLRQVLCGTLALLLWPSLAAAQSSATGSLAGTVSDPSGGVLPGANVRALNPQTGVTQSTVTGGSGEWRLAALPVGRYELSFELDGFKKLTRSDVLVEAVVTRQLNVTLDVGAMSDQITVQADAPLVVANTAATYRRLNAEELTQVPTSTRSFTHLLSAEAGVSADLPPVLDQRHRQHLAVGERHPHDQHEPVLQRHRRDQHHVERRLDDRQHLAGARDARGSQAADEPLRCVDGPFRRRQLSADHAQRHERVPRRGSTSTSSTRASTRTTSSTTRMASTSPKRGGTRADSRSAVRCAVTGCSSSAATSGPTRRRVSSRPRAASRSCPAALRLIQGARTKENLLAAFAAAQSQHPQRHSQGAVQQRRPTRPAFPTSRSRCSTCGTP